MHTAQVRWDTLSAALSSLQQRAAEEVGNYASAVLCCERLRCVALCRVAFRCVMFCSVLLFVVALYCSRARAVCCVHMELCDASCIAKTACRAAGMHEKVPFWFWTRRLRRTLRFPENPVPLSSLQRLINLQRPRTLNRRRISFPIATTIESCARGCLQTSTLPQCKDEQCLT
jgi:hypothetical protein